LWDQIADHIVDPKQTDAWALYVTQNSLNSEPCREEMNYALNRALAERGQFPVIGIFQTAIASDLIPPALKTRLYVSTTDEHWADKVAAATRGEVFREIQAPIEPYEVKQHITSSGIAIEIRPRAGVWNQPFIAVPKDEASPIALFCLGPNNRVPSGAMSISGIMTYERDGRRIYTVQGECSPTNSGYLLCQKSPSEIMFGNVPGPKWIAKLN
jgi:hypothetical protein